MRKLLLIFPLCITFLYGQEPIKEPIIEPTVVDVKQQKLDRLQAEITAIESKLSYISESPVRYSNEKITKLDNWIKILPDREPTKAGNLTMKQYLSGLKKNIEENPGEYVAGEITRLVNDKKQFEAEITMLSKEVADEKIIQ